MKGSEGLLKLTKFDAATLIFGDIQPQQYLDKQPKYGKLLRLRHFAAKKRPAGDALASSECICFLVLLVFLHCVFPNNWHIIDLVRSV